MKQIGTKNKTAAALRQKVSEMLDMGLETYQQDIINVSPFQRLKILTELFPYVIYRYAPQPNEYELLTDEQIDEIIKRLRDDT